MKFKTIAIHLMVAIALIGMQSASRAAEGRLMVARKNASLVKASAGSWRAVARLNAGEVVSVIAAETFQAPNTQPRSVLKVRPISPSSNREWLWVSADVVTSLSPGDQQLIDANFRTRSDLPGSIRSQSPAIQQAWSEIQAAIAENEQLKQPLPDPYFARGEILAIVHDFDSALRDYLRAVQLAEQSGQDAMQYRAYFSRLKQVLEQYDATPRPPASGEGREHYAHGVHAFMRGDHDEAINHLTNAIAVSPQQAIHWYFRALAYKQAGDEVRAQHDALMGAHAEWDDGLADPLAAALHRVQGSDRLWLEKYRRGDPRRMFLTTKEPL